MISSADLGPGSSRSARTPTPGVDAIPRVALAVGARARTPAGVDVVQEPLHHAVDDERVRAASGTPSPSYCDAPRRARVGRVVDSCTNGAPIFSPTRFGEQRSALQHRLTVERARQHAEDRTGDERIEDHGDAPTRRGLGAEQPARAGGRVARDRVEVEVGDACGPRRSRTRTACPSRRRRGRPPTPSRSCAGSAATTPERVRERDLGRARRRSSPTRRCGSGGRRPWSRARARARSRTFSSVGTAASSSRHRSRSGGDDAVDVGRRREAVPLVGLAEARVVASLLAASPR